MKRNILKNKGLIVLIVILLVVGVGIYRHSKNNNKVTVNRSAQNVTVKKVSLGSITTEEEYPSKLTPNQEISISPKVAGKVAAVNVDIGDSVTQGQVLFTLDTTELMSQLREQQALLDSANANLEKTKGSAVDQQLTTAQQTLDKAQIAYNNANDNYGKMQQLYSIGAISKQDLDNAQITLNDASIDLKAAQDNFNLTKSNLGPQSVDAAEAQVEQYQAAVDNMQEQINDSSITSPITGVISTKSIDVGEMASSASACFTVIDAKNLLADINVPDNMLSKIQIGQSVPVTINALQGKSFSGVIGKISPDVDSKSNTYLVEVKIDNSNGDITSGMFAKVSLPSEQKSNILTVPNEAISVEDGVNYIYTVVSSGKVNKVKKMSVTTGISDDKITEIAGDVKEGDYIITEGQSFLSDGQLVNIAK